MLKLVTVLIVSVPEETVILSLGPARLLLRSKSMVDPPLSERPADAVSVPTAPADGPGASLEPLDAVMSPAMLPLPPKVAPLLTLVEFAEDPELVRAAGMALDLCVLDMAGACWYVLGNDAKGRPIGGPDDVPSECGVMQVEGGQLVVAREAPRRAMERLPFHVWMTLAKAGPAWHEEELAQQAL